MKLLRNLVIAGVLGVAGAAMAAGPASADAPDHRLWIFNDSRCDTATGEWIALYHVQNEGTMNATVSATSSTAPITGLEDAEVAPKQERVGEQRLPADVGSASLLVTAVWADGTVTTHPWSYRNPTRCRKAA